MASAERTSSRKRCKNGTRRNKKTGECVKVASKKITLELLIQILNQTEIQNHIFTIC